MSIATKTTKTAPVRHNKKLRKQACFMMMFNQNLYTILEFIQVLQRPQCYIANSLIQAWGAFYSEALDPSANRGEWEGGGGFSFILCSDSPQGRGYDLIKGASPVLFIRVTFIVAGTAVHRLRRSAWTMNSGNCPNRYQHSVMHTHNGTNINKHKQTYTNMQTHTNTD